MPYPFTFTELPATVGQNSYADENAVQRLMVSLVLDSQRQTSVSQLGGIYGVHKALVSVSSEIDAVLIHAGLQVPPPSTSIIFPVLEQTAAYGAAAILEYARFEEGDEGVGSHAQALQGTYDAMLGLLERQDINGLDMGMLDAGWAPTSNRTKYYASGNLVPNSDGSPKTPTFTMGMQW